MGNGDDGKARRDSFWGDAGIVASSATSLPKN